jgi:hypothetical protein
MDINFIGIRFGANTDGSGGGGGLTGIVVDELGVSYTISNLVSDETTVPYILAAAVVDETGANYTFFT